MTPHRIIHTTDDIAAGVRILKRSCPHMRRAHALAGDPPLRREMGGFEGLARIVVGQQVSIASANAIWARVAAGVMPFTPQRMAGLTEADLKGFGLSRPKIATLSKLARHLVEQGDWLPELIDQDDDAVRDRLIALPGIGPWTADVYLLFCLGRTDSFAPGDLALQVAAQHLIELGGRPDARALAAIAERWRPWRGVAARMLWAYYAAVKRSGTRPPKQEARRRR
jgi:DNA-3-methyladenine glycosylase II